jgi:hypothetical protein
MASTLDLAGFGVFLDLLSPLAGDLESSVGGDGVGAMPIIRVDSEPPLLDAQLSKLTEPSFASTSFDEMAETSVFNSYPPVALTSGFDRTHSSFMMALVRHVTIINPNRAFQQAPGDTILDAGVFKFQNMRYNYAAFTKAGSPRTHLHVYDSQTDRNLYLAFDHAFNKREDLELVCSFLEPPTKGVGAVGGSGGGESDGDGGDSISGDGDNGDADDNASLAFTVDAIPIMTGLSELDSPYGEGKVISVLEEPQEYHTVPLSDFRHVGRVETVAGDTLYFRARGVPVQVGAARQVRTQVVVREEPSGRKLYFTVDRDAFDVHDDMATASYLLHRLKIKDAAFVPATAEEDVGSMLETYRLAHTPHASPDKGPGSAMRGRTDAALSDVHCVTASDVFDHVPATDSPVHTGTLAVSGAYHYTAFSRASAGATYLTAVDEETGRTLRFRMNRGQFVPEHDLAMVSRFLEAKSATQSTAEEFASDDDSTRPSTRDPSERRKKKVPIGTGVCKVGVSVRPEAVMRHA